jgi:hypothetical protein
MHRDIKQYVRQCESCQKNKVNRQLTRQPLEITTTSTTAFQRIALDIVGPLNMSENGNRYILTLQDDLTKFSQAYPIPNHEAETIAKQLTEKFICNFGIPTSILTDQGKDFTSNLLKNVAKLFKIKQIQTTAYRPQSNGGIEKFHACLADLKHFISDKLNNWDEWVPFAIFSYNSTPHTSTKFSPHELVFGQKPELPTALKHTEFKYTYDSFLDNLKLRLTRSHEIARNNLINQKHISKKYYDKKAKVIKFNKGDSVYLYNNSITKSKKLSPNYQGPYEVMQVHSPVNVSIKIKNKLIRVHTNRLKHAISD